MARDSIPVRIDVRSDVYLSAVRHEDRDRFVACLNDQEIYNRTLRIPYPYSAEDAQKFTEITAAATAAHGHPVHFAVRNCDDQLIGGCGFDGLIYGHRTEIGYWLARTHWGRGVMTDVVRAACEFAIARWSLVRITAHVFEFNHASARVLEKNAFVLEGRLRKHYQKDGAFLNSRLYALVK